MSDNGFHSLAFGWSEAGALSKSLTKVKVLQSQFHCSRFQFPFSFKNYGTSCLEGREREWYSLVSKRRLMIWGKDPLLIKATSHAYDSTFTTSTHFTDMCPLSRWDNLLMSKSFKFGYDKKVFFNRKLRKITSNVSCEQKNKILNSFYSSSICRTWIIYLEKKTLT